MRITVFLFFLLFCSSVGAQSTIKSEAELYFENGVYDEALKLYQQYLAQKPKDDKVYDNVAVCYIENGQPAQSLKFLKLLLKDGNPDKEWILHNAEALHLNQDFKQAILYYKKYLTMLSDSKKYERQLVKDQIKRCVNGFKLKRLPREPVIVENLGRGINTTKNEFAPIPSPNHSDKIYFSAIREDNVGDKYDQNYQLNPIYGKPNTDIFFSVNQGGDWLSAERMSLKINSGKNDILLDFATNGQALYSLRSSNPQDGQVFIDRFYQEYETPDPLSFEEEIEQPHSVEDDFFFFNEDLVFFASNRLGGFGGYDLYFSTYNLDSSRWNQPVNLGGKINSPYDEKDPFLAMDGRTLFFASNSLKSIGGYDIFKTFFNDTRGLWGEVKNLGLPINSSKDEGNFRFANKADLAYYDSNKPGGRGSKDIYAIYYKSKQGEHVTGSEPLTFVDVQEFLSIQDTSDVVTVPSEEERQYRPADIERLYVRTLYYNEGETMLNVNNKGVLDKVANILKSYPTARLTINTHADNSSSVPFSMYTSYEKGKEIFNYLTEKGAISTNMTINAHGNLYPSAVNNQEVGQKLNRSVSIYFEDIEDLPLDITYDNTQVSEILKVNDRDKFRKLAEGLVYRIEIKKTNKLFNDAILERQKHIVAESSGFSKVSYSIGLYKSYLEAVTARKEFTGSNPMFESAYLVPFVNGVRVQEQDLARYAEKYPDLYRFINN